MRIVIVPKVIAFISFGLGLASIIEVKFITDKMVIIIIDQIKVKHSY
jgi:hypothetical protein